MSTNPPKTNGGASLAETARHLFISRERVRQLVAEQVLERRPDMSFDPDACRRNYIGYLQSNRPAPSSEASERVKVARAAEIELRTAERRHELVRIDEVLAFVDFTMGPLVVDLDAVAPRIIAKHPGVRGLREDIEAELGDVRNRGADRFAAKAAELAKNGKIA